MQEELHGEIRVVSEVSKKVFRISTACDASTRMHALRDIGILFSYAYFALKSEASLAES